MRLVCTIICVGLALRADAADFATIAFLTDATALTGLHDVELDGPLAYVAGKGGTVAIIDVADPTKPRLVWSKQDAKLFEDAETVLPLGKHLFLGSRDFHVLDISDSTSPKVLHTISDRPRIDRINGMVRLSNTIFAANKDGWIDAFDVTDPAKPKLFGTLDVKTRDGIVSPHDIDRLGDDRIIVTDANGFGRRSEPGRVAVYQVAKEGKLLPAEKWTLSGKAESHLLVGGNRVRVMGQTAVVAGSISPQATEYVKRKRKPSVYTISMVDPEKPFLMESVPFPDVRGPNGLCVAGKVAFAAGGQTILAIDLSDPWMPEVLGTFKDTKLFSAGEDDAHDLAYRDGYLYVTAQNSHSFGVVKVLSPKIKELASKNP